MKNHKKAVIKVGDSKEEWCSALNLLMMKTNFIYRMCQYGLN